MQIIKERRSNERLLGDLYIRLQKLHAENELLKKRLEAANQQCESLTTQVQVLKSLTAAQQSSIDSLAKKLR